MAQLIQKLNTISTFLRIYSLTHFKDYPKVVGVILSGLNGDKQGIRAIRMKL